MPAPRGPVGQSPLRVDVRPGALFTRCHVLVRRDGQAVATVDLAVGEYVVDDGGPGAAPGHTVRSMDGFQVLVFPPGPGTGACERALVDHERATLTVTVAEASSATDPCAVADAVVSSAARRVVDGRTAAASPVPYGGARACDFMTGQTLAVSPRFAGAAPVGDETGFVCRAANGQAVATLVLFRPDGSDSAAPGRRDVDIAGRRTSVAYQAAVDGGAPRCSARVVPNPRQDRRAEGAELAVSDTGRTQQELCADVERMAAETWKRIPAS